MFAVKVMTLYTPSTDHMWASQLAASAPHSRVRVVLPWILCHDHHGVCWFSASKQDVQETVELSMRHTVQTSINFWERFYIQVEKCTMLHTDVAVTPSSAVSGECSQSASTSGSRALTVPDNPQDFGIHVYSQAQIENMTLGELSAQLNRQVWICKLIKPIHRLLHGHMRRT